MKVSVDIPQEIIEQIAQAVVERMRLMQSSSSSPSVAGSSKPLENRKLARGPMDVDQFDMASDQDQVCGLPPVGYLRLKRVLTLIPVSKSTWFKGINDGRYPKPSKRLGPRITVWDVRDIRSLLERVAGSD